MSESSRPDTDIVAVAPGEMYCANHPSVPTALRCNRCGKPICVKCAVLTPVGYRCRECVRGQQSIFYTAGIGDYIIAAVVTLPLSLLAGFIASAMGGFLFYLLIFGGPLAGRIIADVAHRAAGRRRGRYLWLVVCICIALGVLPFVAPSLVALLLLVLSGGGDAGLAVGAMGFSLLRLGFVLLYAVLAIATAYSRLRFGR